MRIALKVLLIILALGGPLYARTIYEAYTAYSKSKTLKISADPHAEILLIEAVRWNSPGNFYSIKAADDLLLLAKDERNSQHKLSLLQNLRSALFGSRSFLYSRGSREEALLTEIDKELYTLDPRYVNPPIKDDLAYEIGYRWQGMAHLFFWLWIGSTCVGIMMGFTKSGEVKAKALCRFGVLSATSLIGWLIALRFA